MVYPGLDDDEEVTVGPLNIRGRSDRISDVVRLEAFMKNVREDYPAMMSKGSMDKVVREVHAAQITYSSLQRYVKGEKKSTAPFTAAQANMLHRKIGKKIISLNFINILLEKYQDEQGDLPYLIKREGTEVFPSAMPLHGFLPPFEIGSNFAPPSVRVKEEPLDETNNLDEIDDIAHEEDEVALQGEGNLLLSLPVDREQRLKRKEERHRQRQIDLDALQEMGNLCKCKGCSSPITTADFWKCTRCEGRFHNYCDQASIDERCCSPCWAEISKEKPPKMEVSEVLGV